MKTLLGLIFGKKGYFFWIVHAHIFLYKKVLAGIIKRSPSFIALFLLNINSVSKIKFGYDKNKKLFVATEDEVTHYFSNAFRGNWLYNQGLYNRSLELIKSYGIDKISFKPNDIIIDVGANYGDIGIYLKKTSSKLYGFEPDEEAYRALKENNYFKVFKIALSDKKSVSKFYLSSSHADSSLVANEINQKFVEIQTDKLDNLFNQKNKIKLIKLEAEGYEPEILKGSKKILKKTEFVCVDGGPERGLNKIQTIEELTNILVSNNFELLYLNVYKNSGKALFKNKNHIH